MISILAFALCIMLRVVQIYTLPPELKFQINIATPAKVVTSGPIFASVIMFAGSHITDSMFECIACDKSILILAGDTTVSRSYFVAGDGRTLDAAAEYKKWLERKKYEEQIQIQNNTKKWKTIKIK